jgi:glycosyltransferase involved in cell wall biosynthesis
MTEKSPVSLCIIVKNEPFLEKCLQSIRPYIEELVVVDTGSTDNTPEIAKKYADIFEVYTDCNDPTTGLIEDFSQARQRSFDLATKDWILWCDADDTIEGCQNLPLIIEDFKKNYTHLDTISYLFPYEYAYNELGQCTLQHYRERLFYKKDFYKWVNPVHEVLIPKDNVRVAHIPREDLVFKHHRQFSPKMHEPDRNLRILKKYYEKVGDSDARQLYYLGLECANAGLIDESIQHLTKYVSVSGWEDERVMACLKLVDIYQAQNNLDDGIKWAFKSIEIKENWGEGYFALARMFYFFASRGGPQEMRNWERCAYFAKAGLNLPPTKTLLFINPLERDSEIHKYLNLALNKLGDVVGALNSVNIGIQKQPNDPNFLNNKRLYEDFLARQKIVENTNVLKNNGSLTQVGVEQVAAIINNQPIPGLTIINNILPLKEGMLDVVFFVGDGVEVWTPESFKQGGLGGSETMCIELTKRLAAQGHRVRVYSSCGAPGTYDKVEYYPSSMYKDLTCDVLVVSRNAQALDDAHNITAKLKLIWAHDIYVANATNERLLKADRILALSEWHRQNLINAHNVHPEHVLRTRNGIDLSRFEKSVPRNRFKAVNSSSPDRSWPILLDIWPQIKEQVPEGELHLYYGFKNWEASAKFYPGQPELIASLKQKIKDMAPMGVVYHDRINQEELAKEFLSAGVLLYPTWFTETSYLGGMEAQAAGLRIVSSSIAALNETVADRGVLLPGEWTSPEYKEKFVQVTVKALNDPANNDRNDLQRYAKEHFGLDTLAKDWEAMFHDLIETMKTNPIVPYYPTTQYRTESPPLPPPSIPATVNIVKSRKPKISVLDLTNRVGGIDILFESLKAQSFQDFELIIVDALYKYRKDVVAEKAKAYNFPVKHIEPLNNTFPVSNYNNSMNSGLIAAEGEVVYFTCDYAYLMKNTLLTHANFHSKTPRNHILLLPINDCPVKLDAVSDNFPKHRQYGIRARKDPFQLCVVPEEAYMKAHNEWSERYAEDINNGFLDKVMWSIFDMAFSYEDGIEQYIDSTTIDTKFANCPSTEPAPVFHDLCCVKNDSFKLDFLMEANGFDEEMDGTHGFFDTELARRLLKCHGGQFFAMNTGAASVINTRYYLQPRKVINGYNNLRIIDAKYNREQPLTNNSITEFKKRTVNI